MDKKLREEVSNHIKEFEGYSALVYECPSGYLSIAHGRNLEQRGITKEEANYLLQNDIDIAIKELSGIINNFKKLPSKVKLVLIDMHYNLGLSNLLGFEKMLDAIDQRDFEKAAEELLDSRYAIQVKRRALANASLLNASV
jgi:lysozyme